MNCPDYEKDIWLYDELSVGEQQKLHAHLHSCEDCQKLFDEIQATKDVIQRAKEMKPQLQHAAAFTNRVMDRLPAERESMSIIWQRVLENSWFHNAMRLASLVLIVFFIWEQRPTSYQITKLMPRQNSVFLNSLAFIKKYDESRKTNAPESWYARYLKVKQSTNHN
ncbi:MAG: hypothetical protein HOP30_05200 [Cyclobacteriaceae bacterium]|nr:hypothetical protein [Cyclobacteriaceae bacterium]